MKVKQVVEFEFHNVYTSWNALEFSDSADNSVSIKMTDDDYLSLANTLEKKANRIRKERAELAAEEARAEAAKLEKENDDEL